MPKTGRPLKEETHRSVWIGFAGNLVTMGGGALMAYLAGPLGAFVAINAGFLIAALGYWPKWFKVLAKSNSKSKTSQRLSPKRLAVGVGLASLSTAAMDGMWHRFSADPPAPLTVSRFKIEEQETGKKLRVTLHVTNSSLERIQLKGTYKISEPMAVEVSNTKARKEIEDVLFSKALSMFDDLNSKNALTLYDAPPGSLGVDLFGDVFTQQTATTLSKNEGSIFFAGLFEYQYQGRTRRLAFCGFTESMNMPLCIGHNDPNYRRPWF